MRTLVAILVLVVSPACGQVVLSGLLNQFEASAPPPAAIIGFNAHSQSNATANATTYLTTAATTFSANSLALVAVVASDTATDAITGVSGCGMTWVNVWTGTYNTTFSISLWRSMTNATSLSGVLTATFAAGKTGCNISAMEFTNVATGGTYGSAAIVQTVAGTNTTGVALTLATLGTGQTNAVFAMFGNVDNNGAAGTAEAGYWVEQYDKGYSTPSTGLYVVYALRGTDTTVDPSMANQAWGGIAVEIAAKVP